MTIEFQGKKLSGIPNMIYWYKWGDQEFDIRNLRAVFKRKQEKAIDVKFTMHRCTRFREIANEIIGLVGQTDFNEILKLSGAIDSHKIIR